ncbi:MAG: hypothetical protein J0L75_07465 [Spirochaetes bacterium]|nr:hypothetical protein [Spirochaetota bacterium]
MQALLGGALILMPLVAADRLRIAVYQFDSRSGVEPAVAGNVTDLFQTEFARLNRFDVLERANLQRVIKEQSIQSSGCVESSCAVKLGNLLGVQKMVVGAVFRMGGAYYVNLHFVDVELARVDFSESASTPEEHGLPALIAEMALNIVKKIPVSARIVKLTGDRTAFCNLGVDDGVRPGETVQIVRLGEAVMDPGTGALLGRDRTVLGEAQLTEFTGLSFGTLRFPTNMEVRVGDLVMPPLLKSKGSGLSPLIHRAMSPRSTMFPQAKREAPPVEYETRDVHRLKAALLIAGPVLAAGGGVCLALGLDAQARHPALKLAYDTASTNAADAYSAYSLNYQNAVAFTAAGVSLLSVGVPMLLTGVILPRVIKKPIRIGLLLGPGYFQFQCTAPI